ncbi:MAG: dockerin type I domain-containing protein [Candidatus Azambacteria bacterium]|nr:dockerin type I domain-containing protein [Candidatus Azambacteria bacterium]
MKNKLYAGIAGFVMLAFVVLPNLSSAATVDELQAQINVLMTQIKSLQQQLAVAQQGATQQWCYSFNVNLRVGDKGNEIIALQTVLAKDGTKSWEYKGYDGIFDEMTASAIVGFQQKYADEILTPNGLKYGTGFVGPSTRAKLNKLYGCGVKVLPPITPPVTPIPTTTTSPTTPSITVLSPNGGEVWYPGETHAIRWNNNNIGKDAIYIYIYDSNISGNGSTNYITLNGQSVSGTQTATGSVGDSVGAYYNWTIPPLNQLPGGGSKNYKIRIDNASNPTISDSSDAPFSIVATETTPSIKLNVSVAGTPVSQNIIAGSSGVIFANYILDAGQSSEDVRITSMQLNLFGNSQIGDLTACAFYDGNSILNTGSSMMSTTGAGLYTFVFDANKTPIIAKGYSKNLALKCNISSVAKGSYAWGIASGAKINAVGVSSGNTPTVTVTASNGNLMTVISRGTWKVELDTSSPVSSTVYNNSTDSVVATVLKISALNEAINVTSIGLQLGGSISSGAIVRYSVWDEATLAAEGNFINVPRTATALFVLNLISGLNIPKDSYKKLIIEVNFSASSGLSAGDTLSVGYDGDSWSGGKGVFSGALIYSSTKTDVVGNAINIVSAPTSLQLGDADGSGKVDINDSLFIAQYVEGKRTFTSAQLAAADVNKDGKVTTNDAKIISQYDAGKFTSLPVAGVKVGDVDKNGKVNIFDSLLVGQYLAGQKTFDAIQEAAADVNNDNQITQKDADTIASYDAGIIKELPTPYVAPATTSQNDASLNQMANALQSIQDMINKIAESLKR